MCCEHLLCAACSGPVSEARCPTCRISRAEVHHHRPGAVSAEAVALILLLIAVLMTVARLQG
jgi:hypothetical protein